MSLQRLTLLALFLTFDLVLFGAFTRLTDSGLGCPDWPGCYGHMSPIGAHTAINAAQEAMPTGPVTHGKAWVEMVHRYLAMGVGFLILCLAVGGIKNSKPLWPVLTLIAVCVQGAFGAFTVTMKLFPAIVTLHLLGGMSLLALLSAQLPRQVVTMPKAACTGLVLLATLVVVQIGLGAWVSSNYAVLACSDFPQCQGQWWPQMNFNQGFEWWRALGQTGSGESISFPALTAIHYVHRLMAYVVLFALVWTGLRLQSRKLLLLAGWQLLSGLSNVVLGWPLVAALAHTAGAAGIVIVITGLLIETRSRA